MTNAEQIQFILNKARKLEGKTIAQVSSEMVGEKFSGKGSFGHYLETVYFGIKTNSRPEPDFWPIPLELKAAPLKETEKRGLVPKERIVLGIINYDEIVNETFESSHFKFKNEAILIVWYLYNKAIQVEKSIVELADIWRCIEEDKRQIEEDWNTICNKVKTGHAEDLSEGDTLFLGACTKGATMEKSFRTQPYSPVLAKQRAFCFKTSYVNHIYSQMKIRKKSRKQIPHLRPENDCRTMEEFVLDLFQPYVGMTSNELENELNIQSGSKARFALYTRAIIGFSQKNKSFYEFDAANIQIKTIRLERNGKPKEDMSFKNINFKEMYSQNWEDSTLYQELVSKFIFVIFKKCLDCEDYYLSGVKFWNMPEQDLDSVQEVWEKTKLQVIRNDFDNLPKKSEHPIIHVRTKGKDSSDLVETPYGTYITKRCFFINNSYVKQIVEI